MNVDLPREPHRVGRVVVLSLTVVAAAALISGCSQQSDNQTAQQQQQQAAADDPARKDADEKVWNDTVRANTVAALNSYILNFAAGAHVAEARARITALNEQT